MRPRYPTLVFMVVLAGSGTLGLTTTERGEQRSTHCKGTFVESLRQACDHGTGHSSRRQSFEELLRLRLKACTIYVMEQGKDQR